MGAAELYGQVVIAIVEALVIAVIVGPILARWLARWPKVVAWVHPDHWGLFWAVFAALLYIKR